jgi:hypothetical protein
MSITLDDEQTRHIFLTLVESLERGERLPTKILVRYLEHSEAAIRKLAVELIEYGNDPGAIPTLLGAAADSNVEISLSASEVLRSFRNPAAVEYLIEGLKHPAAETRLAAVVALRERRAPGVVDGLLRNLSDVEPEVRREAVIALAHYRNHDLLPALRSALRHESPAVRKVAVAAVAGFDGALVFDDVEKYLPHDGKYKDVIYDIQWKSFPSGPPLNSELLANKLDIGQMADFPAILGAAAFQAADDGVRTHCIATLSGGVTGAGNALVCAEGLARSVDRATQRQEHLSAIRIDCTRVLASRPAGCGA